MQLSEYDLSASKVSSSDLNSVKMITANGSAVPPICKHKLRKIFPLSALHLQGYGQTETYVFTLGLMEYNGLGAIDPRVTVKVRFDLSSSYLYNKAVPFFRLSTLTLGKFANHWSMVKSEPSPIRS